MPSFDNEIQRRAWSRADINAPHLTEAQTPNIYELKNLLDQDLGIPIGQDNQIPFSEGSYVPRLYVLTLNEQQHETTMSPDRAGAPLGSPEFWRQVQLGNVYAFPLGKTRPVQLQAVPDNNGNVTLQYSKPVTPENMPAPPAKPLGFWKRAAWLLTGGRAFNKQRLEYKNRLASAESLRAKLSAFHDARQTPARKEEADKAEQEAAQRRQALEGLRNPYAPGMKLMTEIFQPEPIYNKAHDKQANKSKYGLYTREMFDTLKRYGKDQIDLSQIKLGGKPVSPEEFSCVAAMALWAPKNLRTMDGHMDYDPHAADALREAGVPETEIPYVELSNRPSFVTTDLFIIPPRDSEGMYFEKTTNAGRQDAVEAFRAYAKGDPTKLAGILAYGVNVAAKDMATIDNHELSSQMRGSLAISDKAMELLERDPALKQAALQAGMKPEHYETLGAARELMKLDKQAAQAKAALTEADRSGGELSAQQKQALATAIVKSKIANTMIAADNRKDFPAYDTVNLTLMSKIKGAQTNDVENWKANPGTRPSPGKGQIWSDTFINVAQGLKGALRPTPDNLRKLPNPAFQKHLDQLAEQIVVQQKLTEKSTGELNALLAGTGDKLKLSKAIPAAEMALQQGREPQPQQPQPAPQPQIVKQSVVRPGVQPQPQQGGFGVHA